MIWEGIQDTVIRVWREWDVEWYVIILRSSAHFALGFGVGLLAYWLTSTILSRISRRNGEGRLSTLSASCIRSVSFYLALSLSVWSHVLQDFTLDWF